MKQILIVIVAAFSFGCSRSPEKAGIFSHIEVLSVTVVDGIDGHMHSTFAPEKNQKLYLSSDGKWVQIKVNTRHNGLQTDTKILHYRDEALIKFITEE
ncbi:hypothetical protein P4C99_05465 [Pontiellaceae bacterium B1224]|nr:hypothetical protein [Pontiellaceae bacterium B1224]